MRSISRLIGNVKLSDDSLVAVVVYLASYSLTKSLFVAGLITGGVLAVWVSV